MKNQGIKVKVSKNFYASYKYNIGAGTPEQRAEDINSMFSDKYMNAILGVTFILFSALVLCFVVFFYHA